MKGPGADAHYWEALAAGRLEMQRCAGCQRWHWPAVWRCGECGSWDQAWHPVALTGRIFSWTRTWHDFSAAPEFKPPFVGVVVELDDAGGKRLIGTLIDSQADVHIGMRVNGEISHIDTEDGPLPALRWRIAEGARA
jgi:uncharacterized OB-fold protein